MKIGNLELENKPFLAPMAGVTDLPFRLLCKRWGAGLSYTEMISAKGILYENENTKSMLQIHPDEKPVALQLFGSSPLHLAKAAEAVAGYGFSLMDINMGCPAPKIVKNNEGSALMKSPALIGEIIKEVKKAVDVPVTIKIRKGFSASRVNALEVAQIAEQAGADAICIHGRLREEYYSGLADWEIVKKVKAAVKIPVIGNGDLTSLSQIEKLEQENTCDFYMIGRAACGNPWVFLNYTPSLQEKKQTALEHAKMLVDYKGEYTGIREMRKHLGWYMKGLPGAAGWKVAMNQAETLAELTQMAEEAFG